MAIDIVLGRSVADKEKFGMAGTILVGRQYVKMGQITSLSNNVYMDVARAHVVFVVGKRGCLTEEALVFTDKGYKRIKDFNEKKDKIYSFDVKNKSFEWESAKLLSFDINNEDLYEIRLLDGQILKLTNEHPLLVYDKGKLVWRIASEITKNDKIVAVYDLPNVRNNTNKLKFWTARRRKSTFYIDEKLFCLDVVDINKIKGIKKVYDLRVSKNHSFIANGVVSHNSGKSYTMGAIAEGMVDLPTEVSKNLSIIMLDTMGVYWTMKYPNHKDEDLLRDWGFKGKGLGVVIYTPFGYYDQYKKQGIPTDHPFSLKPSELSAMDWGMTFDVSVNDPIGVLIERVINILSKKGDYSIKDLIKTIQVDKRSEQAVRDAAENHFLNADNWGLFSEKGTSIHELAQGGKVTVLDVSCYATQPNGWAIKALVIGLISQKLFVQRMEARKLEEYDAIQDAEHYFAGEKREEKEKMPLVWLIIDEAHEFLPVKGKTASTDALVTILREGRQPGISLILATQQPGKIHTDVMTQSDIVISHRITAKLDTDALGLLAQTYMREGLDKQLNILPRVKGSAVVLDDQNERLFSIRIRPRFTWHGGESPVAVKAKKKEFEF